MSGAPQHIIQHAAIDVEMDLQQYRQTSDAVVKGWCMQQLLELVDEVLTETSGSDEVVVIDTLSLDLPVQGFDVKVPLSLSQKQILKKYIIHELNAQMPAGIAKPLPVFKTEQVLFYLMHGYFKQAFAADEIAGLAANFKETIVVNDALKHELRQIVQADAAAYRAVELLGDEFVVQLLQLFTGTLKNEWQLWLNEITEIISAINKSSAKNLLVQALSAAARSTIPAAILANVLAAFNTGEITVDLSNNHLSETVRTALQIFPAEMIPAERKKIIPAETDRIPVSNAGLVLLAAFIPQLCNSIGLLDEAGKLRSPETLPMLWHYLATKEMETTEWELAFPKILSGLELSQNCSTAISLTSDQIIEIENMLQTVIGHWAVLKSTSPDGLRQGFLQRTGRVALKNGPVKLFIAEQAMDILLSAVPWNFRMLKLPWMTQLLTVEWG